MGPGSSPFERKRVRPAGVIIEWPCVLSELSLALVGKFRVAVSFVSEQTWQAVSLLMGLVMICPS